MSKPVTFSLQLYRDRFSRNVITHQTTLFVAPASALTMSSRDGDRTGAGDDGVDVFAGVLEPEPQPSTSFRYYQDRNKRWAFHTNAHGANLLRNLFTDARRVIAALDEKINAISNGDAAEIDAVRRAGTEIYAKKPNIKEKDVTWSQEEYRHAGLQREYCKFKSVQRFTETWACLERARYAGVFEDLVSAGEGDGDGSVAGGEGGAKRRTVRFASLGGGPGFELVAVREFFAQWYPTVELDLVCLDVEEAWRGAAEALGLRFFAWDMQSGGVERVCGGPVDYALASYVFKMYMCEDVVADWFSRELSSVRAAFIINRDEYLKQGCSMMESRGVRVSKLLKQTHGRDDRQLVFSRHRVFAMPPSSTTTTTVGEAHAFTFPNVPYEDHRKRHNHGSGGGSGGSGGGSGGHWRRPGGSRSRPGPNDREDRSWGTQRPSSSTGRW